jgi:hypothetical protein
MECKLADSYRNLQLTNWFCTTGERVEGRPKVSDCLTTPVCLTSTFHFKAGPVKYILPHRYAC